MRMVCMDGWVKGEALKDNSECCFASAKQKHQATPQSVYCITSRLGLSLHVKATSEQLCTMSWDLWSEEQS